ncbi:MAG: hypothetical protein IJW21_05390, partial [Clostridia bacterium]|nr:hypothetical protein [Clostridia bacterium]
MKFNAIIFILPLYRVNYNPFYNGKIVFLEERKRWRTFEKLSTFFFEKKVAKKQKSLPDLSGFVSSNKGLKVRASPRT